MNKYNYNWSETHENKLMKVLEYFLSLHEADEIFDALYDTTIDEKHIEEILNWYHENPDAGVKFSER